MCTVHTINLICRVERLSELNQRRWLAGGTGAEFYSSSAYVDRRHRLYARPCSFVVLTPRIAGNVLRFRSLRVAFRLIHPPAPETPITSPRNRHKSSYLRAVSSVIDNSKV